MATHTDFPAVYPGLEKTPDLIFRTAGIKLLSSDVRAIVGVAGTSSIITHICQNAIRTIAEHISTNDWTVADYTEFVEFLRKRSAPVVTSSETSPSNVARRNPRAGKPTPKPAR